MPFETVALDFIIKLPISQGFDSILTITNQGCTKVAIFIPCNEDSVATAWLKSAEPAELSYFEPS
jgi:hypothetical protein